MCAASAPSPMKLSPKAIAGRTLIPPRLSVNQTCRTPCHEANQTSATFAIHDETRNLPAHGTIWAVNCGFRIRRDNDHGMRRWTAGAHLTCPAPNILVVCLARPWRDASWASRDVAALQAGDDDIR